MIDLSTASLFYFAFLAVSPLVLRNNSGIKKYVFLGMNLAVFGAGLSSPVQAVVSVLWILLPYYLAGWAAKRKHGRSVIITLMVAVFAYLMHYDALWLTLGVPYVFAFRILGLSYFLFRQIDFIMQYDYLREEGTSVNLVDYLNYLLSFFTLLAGPILRYQEFVEGFYEKKEPLEKEEIFSGLNRAVNGYIKVYVFSAICSYYAGIWFDGLSDHSSLLTGAGAFFVFALLNGWFIYFNFSGYCDIVGAFSSLAGIPVHENFNRPYLARSVAEFWNRHHITLSEWIRDYIYSPLFKALISGPFGKNVQTGQYLALFVTFTVAGIWHGTDVNYLIYGLFQGLGIVVATAFKSYRKKHFSKEKNKAWEKSRPLTVLGRCVTWSYICLTFSFVGYDVAGYLAGLMPGGA